MKKILIISFFSPPSSAIGAVRITKFIKYLLRFGWDVTLLTVKEKYYPVHNVDSLRDIEGAKVIRTDIIKPIKGIKEWGIYWLPYLKRELDFLFQKENFDVSLWTGNPFYHWILAPHVKKNYNLKYVLDFRDEWSFSDKIKKWYGSNFYRFKRFLDSKIAKLLEPIIIKNASAIINVTEELTDIYRSFYKNVINENKFFTVYNGADLDDFVELNDIQKESHFEIIYTGKFGNFRSPFGFFQAFHELIRELNLKTIDIKVILVGNIESEVKDFVEKLNINEYVLFYGYKTYKETLSLIKKADIGLVFVGSPTEGSTKIFDYIALNKKIMVISDVDNARAVNIAKEYGNVIFAKNNVDTIKKALQTAVFNQCDYPINSKVIEFYNREFQTKQLEYILGAVIEGRL